MSKNPDDDLEKFEAFENFCSQAWSRTKPFWIVVLIAWAVGMMVCYL